MTRKAVIWQNPVERETSPPLWLRALPISKESVHGSMLANKVAITRYFPFSRNLEALKNENILGFYKAACFLMMSCLFRAVTFRPKMQTTFLIIKTHLLLFFDLM